MPYANSTNVLDLVAEDLATYIDEMANVLADELMAGGQAPFSVQLTEQQKLDYYTAQLFGPDGSPNMQGRAKEMARLGPETFALVFKAVVKAHPNLMIPPPPAGAPINASPFPTAGPPGPNLPGLPPNLGIPQMGQQALSNASNLGPAIGTGPLG